MENVAPAAHQDSIFTVQEQKSLKSQVIDAKIANELYLRRHPEVSAVLGEAIRQVLLRRPDEPVAYTEDFLASQDLHTLWIELQKLQQ